MNFLQPLLTLSYSAKILLAGLAVTSVFIYLGRVGSAQAFLAYLNDSKKELRRITWPTSQETMNSVWIVAVFVIFAATFWWLVDAAITRILALLLRVLA